MTLPERLAALTAEQTRIQELHGRAMTAVNEAAMTLLRLEAQIALVKELVDDEAQEEPWPPSGA